MRLKDAATEDKFGDTIFVEDLVSRTHFGDKAFTESSAPAKCSGDVLLDLGANASNYCPLCVKVRMTTPGGGSQLAGIASSIYKITKNHRPTQPLPWSYDQGEG